MHDATRFLFYKDMALEENVFRGPSMVFTDRFNPRAHTRHMEELRPTLVKSGARLGADGTTICGCPIGRYAFVGADTVMTKDDASHALVVGNPARPVAKNCMPPCNVMRMGRVTGKVRKAWSGIGEHAV
jgi:UDP-2-acetamido-3-amino-2,3-dideoxy-glucuronate N-acetyltransferase